MTWFRRSVAQFVRARGSAGAHDVAVAAAIWPYIVAPLMGGWTQLDPATAPFTSAFD